MVYIMHKEENVRYEGIRLKDQCDICDDTTWQLYVEYKTVGIEPNIKLVKIPSYHQCEVCGNKRLLRDWRTKK